MENVAIGGLIWAFNVSLEEGRMKRECVVQLPHDQKEGKKMDMVDA